MELRLVNSFGTCRTRFNARNWEMNTSPNPTTMIWVPICHHNISTIRTWSICFEKLWVRVTWSVAPESIIQKLTALISKWLLLWFGLLYSVSACLQHFSLVSPNTILWASMISPFMTMRFSIQLPTTLDCVSRFLEWVNCLSCSSMGLLGYGAWFLDLVEIYLKDISQRSNRDIYVGYLVKIW